MKVHLMSPDEDFDLEAPEPPFGQDVAQDLQLDYLWDAMAAGDPYLRKAARSALLHPVPDPATIRYRQQALADCRANPEAVAALYGIAVEALTSERGILYLLTRGHPETVLSWALRMLGTLADHLDRLRSSCRGMAPQFSSPVFTGLFQTVARELDDDYMKQLRAMLRELGFTRGLLMSAGVGVGGTVAHQVLRRGKDENRGLFTRVPLKKPTYSFTLPDRDEAGFNALAALRDRSLDDVANAAGQSVDHVMAFFSALRAELGFYIGAANLAGALDAIGAPVTTPKADPDIPLRTRGVYDPCLALRTGESPVGNDVTVEGTRLLVVTGANRGGKSTLLRAMGTAQLMMQAGLFAPADRYTAAPVGRLFTHWAREEDVGLSHGKLDEELDRMGRIVGEIRPGDLLLSNESFASTNEAEGSQIALEVTEALVDAGVQVRAVTHLYDFAHSLETSEGLHAVFLRAPRSDTGERSYRLEPGAPLRTSFGVDVYNRLFGTDFDEAG